MQSKRIESDGFQITYSLAFPSSSSHRAGADLEQAGDFMEGAAFLISYLRLLGESAPEDLMLRDRDRKAVVERVHADIFGWSDWSVLKKLAKRSIP